MEKFTVQSNRCLKKDTQGFYSVDYVGFRNEGNPDYINTLKNDFAFNGRFELVQAQEKLQEVLVQDLPKVFQEVGNNVTVCVVPRSKKLTSYPYEKLLFLKTIQETLAKFFPDVKDGINFITRVKDTKTTHFKNKPEYAGEGEMPYCGISLDSCEFLDDIKGKDILLIDDIYTRTVNIDEDMIQALLDKGAKSVAFYAVAYTVYKGF